MNYKVNRCNFRKNVGHIAHFWAFLMGIFAFGCAPVQWQMQVGQQNDTLVWPPPPNPVKARYAGELTGFTQTGQSFKTIIFGAAPEGRIVKPVSFAVGPDERLAVADTESVCVHLYLPQNKKYVRIVNAGDDALISPVSVVFDDNLHLYVTDSVLNALLIFDEDGLFLQRIIQAGSVPFKRPTGVVYNHLNNSIYVADTVAHQIHIFNSDLHYVGSFGRRGNEDGEFNMPTHLAVDAKGQLYVTDAMNFQVQIFGLSGEFVGRFGNHGDGSGDFAMPKGVAVDEWGVVYVAETLFDTIQLFDLQGRYLLSIGSKGTEIGEFWMPSGIFIGRKQRMYVCDTYNKRIQMFDLTNIGAEGHR